MTDWRLVLQAIALIVAGVGLNWLYAFGCRRLFAVHMDTVEALGSHLEPDARWPRLTRALHATLQLAKLAGLMAIAVGVAGIAVELFGAGER